MAVIRQIEGGQVGLNTGAGSLPSMRTDGSIGQALHGFGGALSSAANAEADLEARRIRQDQQIDEFRTDQEFRRWNDDISLEVAKAGQGMDPSGKGYTENVSSLLVSKSEEFLKNVPAALKPKFAELVKTNREEWLNKAAAQELDQRNKWYRQGISDTQKGLQNQVFDNPDLFDAAYQDGVRAIDSSGLSEIEKAEQKRKWKETLALTTGERMVRDAESDPSAAMFAADALGITTNNSAGALVAAVIGAESSGNANAESPVGASGLMQVMPETGAEIARELGDPNFPYGGTEEAQKAYLKGKNVSIKYGTHYLGKMLRRYNGDVPAALVAYNGGPERADTWIKSGRDDRSIPKESADYYKKVLARTGSGKQTFSPADVGVARSFLQSRTDKDASHIAGMDDAFSVKLARLIQSAPAEIRNDLGIYSGARSNERQAELYAAAIKKYGSEAAARKWVAPPGKSMHNHGKAADLAYKGRSLKNAPPHVVKWLHENAGQYGLKFPLANESWHIEDSSTRGGGEPADPRFAELPLEERLKLYDRTENAAQRAMAAQNASIAAAYQAKKDGLTLGIETGEVGSELTILNDPDLADADKASLLKAYRSKVGEQADVSAFTQALVAGGDAAKLNPYDVDQRKIGDKTYEAITKSVGPEQIEAITGAFIKQTGYVPEKVVAQVRSGINGTDVQSVANGLTAALRLNETAPSALKAVPNGEEIAKAAVVFGQYVNGRGMSGEEAARRFMQMNSPEMLAKKEQLKKPAADFVKGLTVGEIENAFDTSNFPLVGQPVAGLTDLQKNAVLADYAAFAEEAFIETGGDSVLAKKLAQERMKDIYAVSSVSGEAVLTKYAPESVKGYPPVDGSHDYIREIAMDAAKQADPESQNVMLVADPKATADDFRNGRLPRYKMMYQDKNGVWQEDVGFLFQIAPDEIKRRMSTETEMRRSMALETRQDMLPSRSEDGGRAAGLDAFLDGPVKAPKPEPVQTPAEIKAAQAPKAVGDTNGFLARQKELYQQSGGGLSPLNIDGMR